MRIFAEIDMDTAEVPPTPYKSLNDAGKLHPQLKLGHTEVWYAKNTRDLGMGYDWCQKEGCLPDPHNLHKTHVLLGKIAEKDPDEIYHFLQGEQWSPRGQAKHLIQRLGLNHTSISVGDVIKDSHGKTWFCDRFGFKQL